MVEHEFPEFSILPTESDTNQWESLGIIYTIQETSGSVDQEYLIQYGSESKQVS